MTPTEQGLARARQEPDPTPGLDPKWLFPQLSWPILFILQGLGCPYYPFQEVP